MASDRVRATSLVVRVTIKDVSPLTATSTSPSALSNEREAGGTGRTFT